jgi:hypothetical protein
MPKASEAEMKQELISYLLTCANGHKLVMKLRPKVHPLAVCLSCSTPYLSKEVQ